MIDAQLHLEAILCETTGCTVGARIVDENMQLILLGLEANITQ